MSVKPMVESSRVTPALTELDPVGVSGVLPGLSHRLAQRADGDVGGAQRRLAGGCQTARRGCQLGSQVTADR